MAEERFQVKNVPAFIETGEAEEKAGLYLINYYTCFKDNKRKCLLF